MLNILMAVSVAYSMAYNPDEAFIQTGGVEALVDSVLAIEYTVGSRVTGGGSAIVMEELEDGSLLCLTNHHVIHPEVAAAKDPSWRKVVSQHRQRGVQPPSIRMMAIDNEHNQATLEVVAEDEDADVAIIKVAPQVSGASVALAMPESARLGSTTWVVGNSAARGLSVHRGVLSQRSRSQGLLSTDAAVNPGNSGGGLFSSDGKLIGMLVYKQSEAEGIAYAIPSDVLERWYADLKRDGRIKEAQFGMVFKDDSRNSEVALDYPVRIVRVKPGSPGERAGLRAGDRVISANGVRVTSEASVLGLQKRWTSDWEVRWRVLRDGQPMNFTATSVGKEDPR